MTNEQIKDTKYIQLQSLIEFMSALGYRYAPSTRKFYDDLNRGTDVVRFNTAVTLHNNPAILTCNWHPFHTDWYTYIKAYHSRVVRKVKLQSDKEGYVKCQSHKIEFMFEDYYALFLGEDK